MITDIEQRLSKLTPGLQLEVQLSDWGCSSVTILSTPAPAYVIVSAL